MQLQSNSFFLMDDGLEGWALRIRTERKSFDPLKWK